MADISQIEVNNVTYQICDATARDLIDNNCAKKDAMNFFSAGCGISADRIYKRNAVKTVSESGWYQDIVFMDKNNVQLGALEQGIDQNGKNVLNFIIFKKNDTSVRNVFSVNIDSNGTRTYSWTDPYAARESLSLGNLARIGGGNLNANSTVNISNTDPHAVFLVNFGTWNYSGLYLVFPNNGSAPISTLLGKHGSTPTVSFLAGTTAWDIGIKNTHASTAQPYSVLRISST